MFLWRQFLLMMLRFKLHLFLNLFCKDFTDITNKDDAEVLIKTGEDAVLTCKAKGNPKPVITWYNPNITAITVGGNIQKYTIETTNTITVVNDTYGHVTISRLIIKAVDPIVDYGTYTCISFNSIGDPDSHSIILNRTSMLKFN